MKTTKLLICAISIAAAVAAARAGAQTFPATLNGITPGESVNGTLNDGAFVQDYPSGVLDFVEFDAFCVEPSQDLGYGETLVYQVQDINLLANYDRIAKLIGGFLSSPKTNADAAAVQWAIWETTTEVLSSPSLFNGNVRITTPASQAIADLADQYLANIQSFTPATLTYLTNDGRQDVVTWNTIPEPSSLGLAALSAAFLFRRRR
jgi:PEP-CTERM motif